MPRAINQHMDLRRSRDYSLTFRAAPQFDITGWAISFRVRLKVGGTSAIIKTVGSGITITSGPRGIITIAIAVADTSSLTLSNALANGEGYVWEIARTDTGSVTTLADGTITLIQEIV